MLWFQTVYTMFTRLYRTQRELSAPNVSVINLGLTHFSLLIDESGDGWLLLALLLFMFFIACYLRVRVGQHCSRVHKNSIICAIAGYV